MNKIDHERINYVPVQRIETGKDADSADHKVKWLL